MEKIVKNYTIEVVKNTTGEENTPEELREFIIRGTANSGMKDRWNEVMPKDCWNLDNFLKNPIMLYQHQHEKPIGTITEIYPTDVGLKFVGKIGRANKKKTVNQLEAIELIEQGIIKSFSVGFIPKDYDYDKTLDVLVYKDVELLEISLVSIPMDGNALMSDFGYKSFVEHQSKGVITLDKELQKELDVIKEGIGAMQISFKNNDIEIKEIKQFISAREKQLEAEKATAIAEAIAKTEYAQKLETELESLVEALGE